MKHLSRTYIILIIYTSRTGLTVIYFWPLNYVAYSFIVTAIKCVYIEYFLFKAEAIKPLVYAAFFHTIRNDTKVRLKIQDGDRQPGNV